MAIVFETPRLVLRRFTLEDAQLLLDLNSDPEVLKYVHEMPLRTEEQSLKILNEIILPQYKNKLGRWAIHLRDGGSFIGWCGLKRIPETGVIDLGYRLKKSDWGNGYAFEAAEHTLTYGFNTLGLDLVIGQAHIENLASLRILEKLGMQFIGGKTVDECPVKVYQLANPNPSASN